jgi:UDP-N-acetylglucosamine 2-epimerase (non-hydrolysing)
MILICYGTRPEFIKVKPIIEKLNLKGLPYRTIFTGQHANIVDELADYNHIIKDKSDNRLNDIFSSILDIPEIVFKDIKYILLQGDTTSVLSLAINAYHRKIKIIHLEAGLRTYDFENPFPEEMNRQLVSRISDIHLCPTDLNKQNLISENCKGEIYVVGNTVLDNIRDIKTSYEDKILITLHRRENHDLIDKWFIEISKIAELYSNLEFILPIHPNPNVSKHVNLLKGINVVNPLKHHELIEMMSKCKLIITDSGGIQEEGSFLNKKIIVCRKFTERPESLGSHSFLCEDPKYLQELFINTINDYKVSTKCPFGDGNSAERIIKILEKLYDKTDIV